MFVFYRWVKKDSTELKGAKNRKVIYAGGGNTCMWVFLMTGTYKPSQSIQKDRKLLKYEFADECKGVLLNEDIHIDWEDNKQYQGDSKHRDGIIIKQYNETGALGIGVDVLNQIRPYLKGISLASVKDLAKATGKSKLELKKQTWK